MSPFELGPMNHVGIAVPDVVAAAQHYQTVFGIKDISEIISMPERGIKIIFVKTPTGQLELIEAVGDISPLRAFMDKHPNGGQHHICFEVDNIHDAIAELKQRGVATLSEPFTGALGTPIVFLDPKDMGGVLIELMEPPVTPWPTKSH